MPALVAVADGSPTVSHDPPSTRRWRRYDRMPEPSLAVQLTTNGTVAAVTSLPIFGRTTGGRTTGAAVSAAETGAGAAAPSAENDSMAATTARLPGMAKTSAAKVGLGTPPSFGATLLQSHITLDKEHFTVRSSRS